MPIMRCSMALFLFALVAAPTPLMAADHNGATAKHGELLDRIVAFVNDDVILQSELKREVALTRRQLERKGAQMPPRSALRKQVLKELISTQLQLQLAKRMGIHVSDDQVNQALSRIARQNGFTLDEMPDRLAARGMDYSQFRRNLRKQLTLRRVRKKAVRDKVYVAPSEVEQYLISQAKQGKGNKEYHVYQIVVRVPHDASAKTTDKLRQKAEKIDDKLKKGADFQATAAAVSDGPNALDGGDLGWLGGGELPKSLAQTILTMDTGTLSEPLKDAQGWHILKLANKRAKDKVIVTQTHARHILIKPDLLVSNKEAEKKLASLRKKIKGGASFSKLAEKYSDDPGSASKGGDLGWVDPGDLVPKFQEVMDKQSKGTISQPFKSAYGWHIVQVLDRRKKNQTEKTRRRQATQAIRQRKLREKSIRWRRNLRDKAYVRIQLNPGGTTASQG